MVNRFREMDRVKVFSVAVFVLLVIQPILELDYLANDFLKGYGLIVPSTIIRFLGLPVLAMIGFFFIDKNKKKSFPFLLGCALVIGIYSVFHLIGMKKLDIHLPANFRADFKIEIKYILILVLPFLMMYCTYLAQFTKETLNKLVISVSLITCSVIFITNICHVSLGSYGGMTEANFISWFTESYREGLDPKLLMSKGWYPAANVLGALLFMLLPLLYKVLYEVKRKWPIVLLIMLHSLCMMMIGTRVATLGVVLVAIAALFSYIGCSVLRLNPFRLKFFMIIIAMIALTVVAYPYTPAIKYQESNTQLIKNLKEEEEKSDGINQMSNQVEQLQKHVDDKEGKDAVLIAVLRENSYLFTFPSIYYDKSYPIEFDPEFWNFVLNEPFEKRSDGRKLQKLFAEYKWDMMDTKEKMLGMGFSRLSEGELILEQDGWRQLYTMGFVGVILFVGPYLLLVFLSTIRALLQFKKVVQFSNLMLLLSVGVGLGAAYYSGHVIDELFTNLYLGFIAMTLFLCTSVKNVNIER